jgi:hypothetical protein
VECKWTDSPTIDCPDVCKPSDCKNGSECWKIATREEFYRSECSETVRVGRVRVFGELPTVFNCSVLTFGVQ